ncbi:MAG TPA: Gfo/Idh/MocA family oxidoreductase [Longimicrobiaceae bacterium]|nr:Gfo/Idh/MocA family oxidoreductase [Longimicrobiaceae bacterium]
MTVRVGILGGGNISGTHALAASAIPGVEVVAVHGVNAEKAAALADRFGAAAHAEREEFLRHRPMELVLVGSPSGRHGEDAAAAAREGLHVLVEKPLEISVERVDALLDTCDRAGVRLGVFYQGRTAPEVEWVKRLIADGRLGRPFLAAAQVRWFRPPEYYADSRWRGTWALDGGGALMNQGIHTVDLLLWLLGEVRVVSALSAAALHSIEVEDTLVATLEFASGALATLETTTAAFPGYSRRVEISGTEGTVLLENDRVLRADLRSGPAAPPRADADGSPSASSPVVSDVRGHRRVIEDFLHALRTGTEPLCGGSEGRRSVAVVEALYRSARSGAPVHLGA